MNPSAGITKLYDEFILQHGKVASRRLFESKLNQITTGKLKCEKTGKLRWIFKDEISGGGSGGKSGNISGKSGNIGDNSDIGDNINGYSASINTIMKID